VLAPTRLNHSTSGARTGTRVPPTGVQRAAMAEAKAELAAIKREIRAPR
jgi:hypothetical protein